MAYSRSWTETTTTDNGLPVVTVHRIDMDDANEQAELQREMSSAGMESNALAAAMVNIYRAPRGAVTLAPGATGLLVMPDASVLSIGATGEVYRDGRRLGTAMVAKLVQVGASIYGRGFTDGKWWRWNGTAWVETPDVDSRLLV
jgi:hypothetical protein